MAAQSKAPSVPTTISISPTYIHRCATSASRASLIDPLTLVFQAEKLPPCESEDESKPGTHHEDTTAQSSESGLFPASHLWPAGLEARLARLSTEQLSQMIYDSAHTRLTHKLSQSNGATAFIVEAGGWSASACWELLEAPPPPADLAHAERSMDVIDPKYAAIAAGGREIFSRFVMGDDRAKEKALFPFLWEHYRKHGNPDELKYWKIAVLSRDPALPRLDGAVRSCIEPFIKMLTRSTDLERKNGESLRRDAGGTSDQDLMHVERLRTRAIWLETGNSRARDLYPRFGFKVADEIVVGGVTVWLMVYKVQDE